MASAAGGTTASQLVHALEASGWALELAPARGGFTGLATCADGDAGPIRLTAYGRDRASVVLLLFEQACARMLPDYGRAS